MATKSHTENFRIARKREVRYTSKQDYDDLRLQEEGGSVLLTTIDKEDHVNSEPPEWIMKVKPIERSFDFVDEKLSILENLYKENLVTLFGEDKHKEKEIQGHTANITKTFSELKNDIKRLDRYPTSSTQEKYMKDNIQSLLASKLRDLSLRFKKTQTDYLQKLQNKNKRSTIGSVLDMGSDGEEEDDDDLERYDTGFNYEQQMRNEISHERISKREQEVRMIAEQTNEIAVMFEEIAEMVNEQGTLFNRIDYNIEHADMATQRGVDEIRPVASGERSFSKRLIILLILVLIAGSIVTGIASTKK